MTAVDISPVTAFLRVRTRSEWVQAALADVPTLMLDHASLELKAAQQAQTLIWRYGLGSKERSAPRAETAFDTERRFMLTQKLSKLAREELRHFEQVIQLLKARRIAYRPLSPSRYARELHAQVAGTEPGRCLDTLIVCAIIEARSCERFYSLMTMLVEIDPILAGFYASLLASESRHFDDYLALGRGLRASEPAIRKRVDLFLDVDNRLIDSPDTELRFHSGLPVESPRARAVSEPG